MTKLSRRRIIVGSGALCATTALSHAFAHDSAMPGVWTPRTEMPFPVQEIYPAAFWRAESERNKLKPSPVNIIVNAGGYTNLEPNFITDRVTWFDPDANIWGDGPPLPAARHHLALVNNNGYLYAIGGFAGDHTGGWRMQSSCWRLASLDGGWMPVRSLPHPQAEFVSASLGGYLHIVGGRAPSGSRNQKWSDHIDTDEHWVYDPAGNRWIGLAPLPTPRNSAAGVAINGALYVIGGRTTSDGNLTAVEVYDPSTDRWSKARPMPKAQGGLAAATLDGKIYVFGGEYFDAGEGGVYADSWEYDPRRDQWRSVAPMPRPRHGLGAVTIGDAIYVIGGAAKAGGADTSSAVDQFSVSG